MKMKTIGKVLFFAMIVCLVGMMITVYLDTGALFQRASLTPVAELVVGVFGIIAALSGYALMLVPIAINEFWF